ncbi:MAG: hypothetical protein LBM66_02815 [Bifidobacteriaceae bacterium]|jgi:hypothetical protein|nr:hypothetical protein [Bifidobacteriaceae bacterium]
MDAADYSGVWGGNATPGANLRVDKDTVDKWAGEYDALGLKIQRRELMAPSGFTSSNDSASAAFDILAVATKELGVEVSQLAQSVSGATHGFESFEDSLSSALGRIGGAIGGGSQ